MKKIVFILSLLAFASTLKAQESDITGVQPIQLARHHGHLCEAETMEKISLHSSVYLLSPESFELYYKARREYVSAVTLWSIGGVVTAGFAGRSVWHLICWFTPHPQDEHIVDMGLTFAGITAGIALGSAILFFTPALVLTLDSHKKIDHVVASHNLKSNQPSLSFGPTRYGVGLSLNF